MLCIKRVITIDGQRLIETTDIRTNLNNDIEYAKWVLLNQLFSSFVISLLVYLINNLNCLYIKLEIVYTKTLRRLQSENKT